MLIPNKFTPINQFKLLLSMQNDSRTGAEKQRYRKEGTLTHPFPIRSAYGRVRRVFSPLRVCVRSCFLAPAHSRFRRVRAGLVLMIGLASSANAQSLIADSARAWITIATRQSGLPVSIDAREIGITPLQNFAITPGEHVFAVRRSFSASWLESDWSERVSVSAGDTLTLTPRFVLGYSINSTPPGAQVWVEGKWVGETPHVLRLRDDERASVTLVLQNYQSTTIEIIPANAAGDELSKRKFAIALAAVPSSLSSLSYDSELYAVRARHRKWGFIAGGISLVAGISAVLLKQEADDAYAAYLVTGTPVTRELYYDRAREYDRYFGVAFGVSQVCFVFSVYSFLKSM